MPDSGRAPTGWRSTTLGALGEYVNGRAFKSAEWSAEGRPIIRIQDLTGSNNNPHYFDGDVEERHVVRPGDLLISWSGSLGAYLWDGPEAVLNQHIFKVESAINKRFHYHLARATIGDLERKSHGSGMVHVTKRVFEETPVSIPDDPLLQEEFANFIDTLEATQGPALGHVASARRLIERLRQSVLTAACSGQLTEDWRAQRGRQDNFLPAGWRETSFGVVCLRVTVGHVGKMVHEYRSQGVPFLRSMNVRELRFDPTGLKFISPEFHHRLAKSALRPGDIVVVRSGFVGTACVIPPHLTDANCSDLVIARPGPELRSQYGAIYVNSERMKAHVADVKVGSAQSHFNTKSMHSAPLHLPPLDEQDEIVQRVDTLLAEADAAEDHLRFVATHIDKLSKAVLYSALAAGTKEAPAIASAEGW